MPGDDLAIGTVSYARPDMDLRDITTLNTISSSPDQSVPLEDIRNQGVSSTFQAELDVTDITHRFLRFVITKFPLLNVSQLQDLQAKDTYFEQIISKLQRI